MHKRSYIIWALTIAAALIAFLYILGGNYYSSKLSLDLPDIISTQKTSFPSQRTASRKTGEVNFNGRIITFCSRPNGSVAEDTDKEGYPNGTKTLITHVDKVNSDGSLDVYSNVTGTIIRYKPKKIYMQDTNNYRVPGKFSDLEKGDCVLLKNYFDPSKITLYAFL